LRAHLGLVALALFLGVLTGAAGVGLLATGAHLISAAAAGTPLLALGIPIALVRLFGVGRGVARYAERLASHRVTFTVLTDLRVWCYRRLAPLAPARLLHYHSGDLLTRLVTDVADLEALYLRVCAPIILALVLSGLLGLLVAQFSLLLAGVLLAYLALAGIGAPLLVHRLARVHHAQVVSGRAALQASLVEALQGMAELLVFGPRPGRPGVATPNPFAIASGVTGGPQAALDCGNAQLARSRTRLAQIAGVQRLLALLLAGLALWTILLLAIQRSDRGALGGADLAMLAVVTLIAFEFVQPLGEALAGVERAIRAGRRIYEVIDAAPEVTNLPGPRPTPTAFDLAFDGVTFAYRPGVPDALSDVSFAIAPGARVAVVGPSGSGKTTLLNLLLRCWDPDVGAVRLGGRDLREFAVDELRRSIAVAGQRSYVFNDTLRRNLLLARPSASDAQLRWALERARLGEIVDASPQGLDRWVGEQGVQLSGGERQRLIIARAVLQDAPVLVLDEPTANLDPATEGELLAQLAGIMAGRTTLYVTHRLVGLGLMDEILVLDAGRLVERGTHQQLVTRGGLYQRMFEVQEGFVRMM